MKEILSGTALNERLSLVNWREVLPHLHYYALNKLERFPALAEQYDVLGLSTELADEAIEAVWEGRRKWNTAYYSSATDLLEGVIDSLVSNYVNSKTVKMSEPLPEDDFIGAAYGISPNPEELYIVKETEEQIHRILREDPDAAKVFDCLNDGLKPREIADELDVDVQDVNNIIKRVKRKLKVITNSKI